MLLFVKNNISLQDERYYNEEKGVYDTDVMSGEFSVDEGSADDVSGTELRESL